jgi:hypothetical protein
MFFGPENICKAFVFGFTCSTFTTHLYLLFSVVTMDHNALIEPGNEFFIPASYKSPACSLSYVITAP